MQQLLEQVLGIAQQAGEEILAVYGTEFAVQTKQDESPLTQADMASHNIIVEALSKLTPDIPVLSEESSEIPFATRTAWSEYWLVDPLDGTKEFVKRNGEFTVNIALIRDGWPVLGVVLAPVLGESYWGAEDIGAFRQGNDGVPEKIRCRFPAQSPLTVVGSRSHAGERLQAFLTQLGNHKLISMGSSLKFCLVADGRADLYPRLGLTSEWDTAAAQCVVEQAGGQVTDTRLQRLRYNTKESLLNPDFLVFGDGERDWSQYLTE